MEGVADQLLEHGSQGRLLKVGGDKNDPIFDKKNVEYRNNAKACASELNEFKPMHRRYSMVVLQRSLNGERRNSTVGLPVHR